jgi:hypothetical protein
MRRFSGPRDRKGIVLHAASASTDGSIKSAPLGSSCLSQKETIMTNPGDRNADDKQGASQREALKQSEKKAAAQQPGSFKDAETEHKTVGIGPDKTDAPIEGIDPPPKRQDIEKP